MRLSKLRAERLLADGRDLLTEALDSVCPDWRTRYNDAAMAAYDNGLDELLDLEAAYDESGEPIELDFNTEGGSSWPTEEGDESGQGFN